MRNIETTQYQKDPLKISIPVDEARVSDNIGNIPDGTTHVAHTMYLEEPVTDSPQGFWESQWFERGASNETMSQGEYDERISALGVPVAPDQWTKVDSIHVPKAGILSIVEFPTDGEAQIRAIPIKRRNVDELSNDTTVVDSLHKYADALEYHGFATGSFNHFRRESSSKPPLGTRTLSRVVNNLVVAPLVNRATFMSVKEGDTAAMVRGSRRITSA